MPKQLCCTCFQAQERGTPSDLSGCQWLSAHRILRTIEVFLEIIAGTGTAAVFRAW